MRQDKITEKMFKRKVKRGKIKLFKEHSFIIWGKVCDCGSECYILQNKFHPWDDVDFITKVKCPNCNQIVEINKQDAEEFYNQKIYSYFNEVEGKIIDLGCGGGFITSHLASKKQVDKIYAIDIDKECKTYIEEINMKYKKIEFKEMDIKDIGKSFEKESVDFLVSRDVFMFIEDTDRYFDDVTNIVKKGIRQMGWYIRNNERMKNQLHPNQIVKELEKRGWKVEVEYLDWYKSGYFIRADRLS